MKEETKTLKIEVNVADDLVKLDLAIIAKMAQEVLADSQLSAIFVHLPDEEKQKAFSTIFAYMKAVYALGKDSQKIKSKWERMNAIFSAINSILTFVVLLLLAAYWIVGICVKVS